MLNTDFTMGNQAGETSQQTEGDLLQDYNAKFDLPLLNIGQEIYYTLCCNLEQQDYVQVQVQVTR